MEITIKKILFQIKGIVIIIACDMTSREAQNFTDICYRLEEDCPISSVERKELLKFERLARAKTPRFSAAGFFDIDRTTHFAFLSVTATYFIILIQFNQAE